MNKNKAFCKALVADNDSTPDIELINQFSKAELTAEDIYAFKIRMCDANPDRVNDTMTRTFLDEFAALVSAKSIPLLKDHNWSADSQLGRVYKAEVKTDEQGVDYVEGRAYVLASDTDTVEKIKSGVYKEVSVAFDSTSTCSICGRPMTKDYDGVGVCSGSHKAGALYDDQTCLSVLDHCTDVFELSIVAVPCQPQAAIIKKLNANDSAGQAGGEGAAVKIKTGGNSMKKSFIALLKLKAMSKAAKAEDEQDNQVTELVDVLSDPEQADAEATPEDIEKIINENEELKQKVAELEAEVADLKQQVADAEEEKEQATIDAAVDEEVEKLYPVNATVKECMIRDIDKTGLTLEDGVVKGLDEALAPVIKKYEGLYGKTLSAITDSKDTFTNSTGKAGEAKPIKKGFNFSTKSSDTSKANAKGFTFN